MHRSALEHGSPVGVPIVQWAIQLRRPVDAIRRAPAEPIRIPLSTHNDGIGSFTEPHSVLGNGIEHRLRSVGELAMTRSTSLVAVCCSSDSARSLLRDSSSSKSRVFSMAITAWSANVSSSAICASVNGRTSWRRMMIDADRGVPSRSNGVPSTCDRQPDARLARVGKLDSGLICEIVDVNRASFEHRLGPRLIRRLKGDAGVASPRPRWAPIVTARRETRRHPRAELPRRLLRTAARHSRPPYPAPSGDPSASEAITRSTSPVAVCCSSASIAPAAPDCDPRAPGTAACSRWR